MVMSGGSRSTNWSVPILAGRSLSSLLSAFIEMKLRGFLKDDPAAGITIRSGGRYVDDSSEVEIPSGQEVKERRAEGFTIQSKHRKCQQRQPPRCVKPNAFRVILIVFLEEIVRVKNRPVDFL